MPPDPQQLWLQLLEAEHDRRAAQKAYDAGAGERSVLQLWEDMEESGERLLPSISASLVDALVAAPDWEAIDRLRVPEDMSPATAVALIATRDPEMACQRMGDWAQRRSA